MFPCCHKGTYLLRYFWRWDSIWCNTLAGNSSVPAEALRLKLTVFMLPCSGSLFCVLSVVLAFRSCKQSITRSWLIATRGSMSGRLRHVNLRWRRHGMRECVKECMGELRRRRRGSESWGDGCSWWRGSFASVYSFESEPPVMSLNDVVLSHRDLKRQKGTMLTQYT